MADIKKLEKRVTRPELNDGDCVWTDAGVIQSRPCDHDDCRNCLFDLGMRKALGLEYGENGLQANPGWKDYLKRHFKGGDRPCYHALLGRIEGPKLCTFNYECRHCPFDQMLDEMDYTQSSVTV